MTRTWITRWISGAALAASLSAAAHAEPLDNWLGDWTNSSSSGVVGVEITLTDGALKISAEGSCSPNPCQWGEVDAFAHAPSPAVNPTADTEAILAVWDKGFSVTTMILNRTESGALSAQTLTYFTDGSGRTDYAATTILSRPMPIMTLNPAVLGAVSAIGVINDAALQTPRADEDCISFDPSTVEATQIGGRWKVVSGSMSMLDAGPEEAEMRRARAVIRRYSLAHQCFVGRPDASLEYWLTATGAPSGPLPIEDCIAIDPNALSVRNSGSHWTVLDGPSHAAFSAPTQAEAERIIEIVQRYSFTQSCYVGRPGPSMRYLRK